jgi:hypothetical protein
MRDDLRQARRRRISAAERERDLQQHPLRRHRLNLLWNLCTVVVRIVDLDLQIVDLYFLDLDLQVLIFHLQDLVFFRLDLKDFELRRAVHYRGRGTLRSVRWPGLHWPDCVRIPLHLHLQQPVLLAVPLKRPE